MTANELKVKITADTTGFDAGMKKATDQTVKLGEAAKTAGSFLTASVTVPLAAAAAAGFNLAKSAGEMADKFLDMKDQLGLSTDTLQELDYIAAATGDSLEAITGVIPRFTSQLDEIQKGTGPTADAMKKLGISVTDTTGKLRPMEDLFFDLVKSLADVEDVTERNSLASQVFGRGFASIAPLLATGSDQIQRLRTEAHTLGLVMSQDALEGADAFRGKLDTLTKTLEVQGREIGIKLMPIIEKLVPLFKGLAEGALNIINGFAQMPEWAQGAGIALGAILAIVGPLLLLFGQIVTVMPAVQGAFASLGAAITPVLVAVGPLVAALGAVAAVGAIGTWAQGEADKIRESYLEKQFLDLESAIGKTSNQLGLLADTTLQAQGQLSELGITDKERLERAQKIAEAHGVTVEQLVKTASYSDKISVKYLEQLVAIRDIDKEEQNRIKTMGMTSYLGEMQTRNLESQKKAQGELAFKEKERQEASAKYVEERQKSLDSMDKEIIKIEQMRKAGIITDVEALARAIDVRNQKISFIEEETQKKGTSAEVAKRLIDQEMVKLKADQEKQKELIKDTKDYKEKLAKETAEKEATQRQMELSFYAEYHAGLREMEKITEEGRLKAVEEKKKKDAESALDFGKNWATAVNGVSSILGDVGIDVSGVLGKVASVGDGISKLVATSGADFTAWVDVITGVFSLAADAVKSLFGVESEAMRKAREARDAERVKIENDYADRLQTSMDAIQEEYAERIAAANRVGVDTLNIETYYAREIAKVRREQNRVIEQQEQDMRNEIAALKSRYDALTQAEIAEVRKRTDTMIALTNKIAEDKKQAYLRSGVSETTLREIMAPIYAARDQELLQRETYFDEQVRLVQSNYEVLFRTEAEAIASGQALLSGRTEKIGSSLADAITNGLKQGQSADAFREGIFDMLRNMAIEAAILASGIGEQFKAIGAKIAEYLVDGFSQIELFDIDKMVTGAYLQAQSLTSTVNEAFNRRAGFNEGSATRELNTGTLTPGSNVVNIFSPTAVDPVEASNIMKATLEEMAFQGAV